MTSVVGGGGRTRPRGLASRVLIFCCFNGLEDQLLVLRCCDLRRCFCQCVICVLEESDGGSGVAFATAVVVVVEEKEEEEKEVVVEGGLLQTGFRLCADEEDVVDAR